MIAKKSKDQD